VRPLSSWATLRGSSASDDRSVYVCPKWDCTKASRPSACSRFPAVLSQEHRAAIRVTRTLRSDRRSSPRGPSASSSVTQQVKRDPSNAHGRPPTHALGCAATRTAGSGALRPRHHPRPRQSR
jgi:hypothetical protein